MVQISDQNFKTFCSIRKGRVTKVPPPSPPLSKYEGLTDIGHSMSIGNLILGVNRVTVSYLIHYDSLLQNATATLLQKCDRSLLQKVSGFLLQNTTVFLQNVAVVTNCNITGRITKLGAFLGKKFFRTLKKIVCPFFAIRFPI